MGAVTEKGSSPRWLGRVPTKAGQLVGRGFRPGVPLDSAEPSHAANNCPQIGMYTDPETRKPMFMVTDSKLGDQSPVLAFTAGEFAALVTGIKEGDPRIEVMYQQALAEIAGTVPAAAALQPAG